MAYEKSSWDSRSYSPGYPGPNYQGSLPDAEEYEKKMARQLRSHGLWNGEDDPETPYANETAVTFYGAK